MYKHKRLPFTEQFDIKLAHPDPATGAPNNGTQVRDR